MVKCAGGKDVFAPPQTHRSDRNLQFAVDLVYAFCPVFRT